jgi:hypothetical protein
MTMSARVGYSLARCNCITATNVPAAEVNRGVVGGESIVYGSCPRRVACGGPARAIVVSY